MNGSGPSTLVPGSSPAWWTRWWANSLRTGSGKGMMAMAGNDLRADLDVFLAGHEAELIEFRRDLHAHPELAFAEHRTTRRVALRLAAEGLRPVILPKGTGLVS